MAHYNKFKYTLSVAMYTYFNEAIPPAVFYHKRTTGLPHRLTHLACHSAHPSVLVLFFLRTALDTITVFGM
jgi:hypothetical protein